MLFNGLSDNARCVQHIQINLISAPNDRAGCSEGWYRVSVSDVRVMMMIMTVMIVILGVMMTLCHAAIIRSHS